MLSFEIVVVYAVLIGAVVLFTTERLRTDVVGILVLGALGVTGILKPKDLLAGFGNPAVITIAAMFVLSASLMRTGVVNALGARLTTYSRGSPTRFLILSTTTVCFLSAFVNNTPVVVVFIPAVLTVCTKLGQSPSKFLLPISIASMFGGSCTLIGTSSNLLVSDIAEQAGVGALGMFEFTYVGVFIAVAGLAYLALFSQRFLPERITLASSMPAEAIKEYVTQVRVNPESHLVGKRLSETAVYAGGIKVVELIRGDRIRRLDDKTRLEVGDVLLMRGDLNKILELDREHEIAITPELATQDGTVKRVEMTLCELMIAPDSPLIGRTTRDSGLRSRYDVSVFALQRSGRHHQRDIADLELRMGDILLVRGTMEAVSKLRDSEAFIVLEGVHKEVVERHKAPIAVGILITIIALAAAGVLPIVVLALAGVGIALLTRLVTARDAYRSIDWSILVLIAGMIAMGKAMEMTGALKVASSLLLALDLGPHALLWIFYFLTAALSLIISNKPTAVLCAPLAVVLAPEMGAAIKPFIMAVAFATSTAMATPMGYQTNLLVYGPGGYTFKDFIKFGLPLNILLGAIVCTVIPFVWDLDAADPAAPPPPPPPAAAAAP